MKTKKRNPQDTTLRNIRALKKKLHNLSQMSDIYIFCLREFHTKYNHYQAEVPHIPPQNIIELRRKLIAEEAEEFDIEAYKAQHGTLEEGREALVEHVVLIADALADILYVVFGTALAYGIDIEKCFLEVHRSNMSKSTEKNEYGKSIKGNNWSSPNLEQFINTPSFGEE